MITMMITELIIECVDWLRGKHWPKHPIDSQLGIETSKHFPRRFLRLGDAADAHNVGHVATHPSVIRWALRSIGVTPDTVFIDLGSGKGRALIVAAEFPFKALVGYELSSSLVDISRRNINKLKLSHRVTIIQSDASKPELPSTAASKPELPGTAEIIIFLNNPFKRPLVELLKHHTQSFLDSSSHAKVWIIYCNPVHYDVFDSCPVLTRYASEILELQADEKMTTAWRSEAEAFIIYQSGPFRPPLSGARGLRITERPDAADLGAREPLRPFLARHGDQVAHRD
jgi:16S rRNA G966 N2-methylase RsmD